MGAAPAELAHILPYADRCCPGFPGDCTVHTVIPDPVLYRFEALQQKLLFICTASTKANTAKKFPSEIIPGVLYLGDWSHAEAVDRLRELGVKRCASPPASLLIRRRPC